MFSRRFCLVLAASAACASCLPAQTREEKVRADREQVESEGFWIYNNLQIGISEAQRTGKPLLVVLRCIPCEDCVKLDEDLMHKDPVLKPLLEKYVRVRIVGTNGLDLSLFQYDYDQSFTVFLMNADKTIYGRYGTRSHHSFWADDVSIPGLAKALQAALSLHRDYPANRALFAGKRGPRPEFATPEKYPSLADRYTSQLDYRGNVVKSCIHCHQIGDAQRSQFRDRDQPLPVETLFQYPHPKILGLILAPTEMATVKETLPGSAAERAGLRPGDALERLEGQPLVSIADVQWVLHHAGDKESLTAEVRRGEERLTVRLPLAPGWRTRDDLSWRATSWPLRRMVTGGMKLEPASDEQRSEGKIPAGEMALHVKHLGQYGPHAAAKQAGFRKDDVLVSFDGRTDLLRETDLLAYASQHCLPGSKVPVTVLRGGRRITLPLPMQR